MLLAAVGAQTAKAQSQDKEIDRLIREKDSLFWQAYNNCDVPGMGRYFTDDVEFYHDKGGITNGKAALLANSKKNLCSNAGYKLRREAIPATVKVFPMAGNGAIYGALISGEHLFYITDGGKPEYLDGHALFTQLWTLNNGEWKMSRILSFDHKPAAYQNKKKEVPLSGQALQQFEGNYLSKQKGTLTVKQNGDHLLLTAGPKTFALFAEKEATFFVKDEDLTFVFSRDGQNKINKMVVMEKGTAVEEATKQ